VRTAGSAGDGWVTGKACTGPRGRNGVYTRLVHRSSGAASTTARLVVGNLRILCGVDDVEIKKGVSLYEVGTLVYCSGTALG
jgi:hypothetical protein